MVITRKRKGRSQQDVLVLGGWVGVMEPQDRHLIVVNNFPGDTLNVYFLIVAVVAIAITAGS